MSVQTLSNLQIAERAYEAARRAHQGQAYLQTKPFPAWASLDSDQKADIEALVADSTAAVRGLTIAARHSRFSGWAHWDEPPMTQQPKGGADEPRFLAALYGEIDAHIAGVSSEILSVGADTLLLDNTEQVIYEVDAPDAQVEFAGGRLQLPASAGATILVKVYEKQADGGSYVNVTAANFSAVQGSYVHFGVVPCGDESGKFCLVPKFNNFGQKITVRQSVEGAGFVTAAFEFWDSAGPAA